MSLTSIFSQDCTKPVMNYFLAQNNVEGYHGDLNFALPGNVYDKAEFFIELWKKYVIQDVDTPVEFVLAHDNNLGYAHSLKYNLEFEGNALDGAFMTLTFDSNLRLKSYYTEGSVEFDQFLQLNDQVTISNSPQLNSDLNRKALRSASDKLLSVISFYALHNSEIIPVQQIKFESYKDNMIYTLEYNLNNNNLIFKDAVINVEALKHSLTENQKSVTCVDGSIDVASGWTSCADATEDITAGNTTFCIDQTGSNHDFFHKFVASGTITMLNNSLTHQDADIDSDCGVGNEEYEVCNALFRTKQHLPNNFLNLEVNASIGGAPYTVDNANIRLGTGSAPIAEDPTYIKAATVHFENLDDLPEASPDGLNRGFVNYFTHADTGLDVLFSMSANSGNVLAFANVQDYDSQAQGILAYVWAAALWRMNNEASISDAKIMSVVTVLFSATGLANNANQEQAATMFLDVADMNPSFTDLEICAIKNIISDMYPSLGIPMGGTDLMIRDTADDVGNEPNEESDKFWRSRDVWNCHSSGCNTHAKPEYAGGGDLEYMVVEVTNIGCTHPDDITGTIEVYGSISATGHSFPTDFMGTYGMTIGIKDISDYMSINGDKIRYEFPWTPFDPDDFPEFGGSELHMCVRAYINAPVDDPMFVNNWNDKKSNNNIVQRNMTIIEGDGMLMEPNDPNFGGEESIFFIAAPEDDPFDPPQTAMVGVDLEYEMLAPANNPMQPINDNDIWIRLDDKILEGWLAGGKKGSGFKAVKGNRRNGFRGMRFYWTDKKMVLKNVLIKRKTREPIRVGIQRGREFQNFTFDLVVRNTDRDCILGGMTWEVRPIKRIERRSFASSILSDRIVISPNPASEMLTIESKSMIKEILMFDLNGRLMQQELNVNELSYKMNIEPFEIGTYFIELTDVNGETTIKKFLKH